MPPTASWAGQPALDAGLARAPAPGKPAAAAPTRKAKHGRSWQREAAHAYGWGLAPAFLQWPCSAFVRRDSFCSSNPSWTDS